jgi:hypothetical protein
LIIPSKPSGIEIKTEPGLQETLHEALPVSRKKSAVNTVCITRQCHVESPLIKLTNIPSTFTVYRGRSIGVFVDLTWDTRPWVDKDNKMLSMASIIKSQLQDSYTAGSGGSTVDKKCPIVKEFGEDVRTQYAEHTCHGIWVCDQLDPDLLGGCTRYEPDEDDWRVIWEAGRSIDENQDASIEARAILLVLTASKYCLSSLSNIFLT